MYYVLQRENQSFSGLSKSVVLIVCLKEKLERVCVQ